MWLQQPGFLDVVKQAWGQPVKQGPIANMITAKFKNTTYALKKWGKKLSHIKTLI